MKSTDPPNIMDYEVPTQNGLDNVKIVSCRSLAGVDFENEKKPLNSLDDLKDESIPPLKNQRINFNGRTFCSNISLSTDGAPRTSPRFTTKSAESFTKGHVNVMSDKATWNVETDKSAKTILSVSNARKQEHNDVITMKYLSSCTNMPIAMDISTGDDSNSRLSNMKETTSSCDNGVSGVVTSKGAGHSTKSFLTSITELCNKLPDLPSEQQATRIAPGFPQPRNTQISALETQGFLRKRQYENAQFQQVPGTLAYENSQPQQIYYNVPPGNLGLGEIRKTNNEIMTPMEGENVFVRYTYDVPKSQLPYIKQRRETFQSSQAQCNFEVEDKNKHYTAQGNSVFAQPSGVTEHDVKITSSVEQDETHLQQNEKSLKPNEYVSKPLPQRRDQLQPNNEVYCNTQGNHGAELYSSKGYLRAGIDYYSRVYNNRYFPPNFQYLCYDGAYERGTYPVTNGSIYYQGYANYSDIEYPYCDCEQCYQAAMCQPMSVHIKKGVDGDYSCVDDCTSFQDSDYTPTEYPFCDTWLSDACSEMSSLIPGAIPTTMNNAGPSKYTELLAVIEELGKDIRPTYAGSKNASERLKKGIMHARALVRECLIETERCSRQ